MTKDSVREYVNDASVLLYRAREGGCSNKDTEAAERSLDEALIALAASPPKVESAGMATVIYCIDEALKNPTLDSLKNDLANLRVFAKSELTTPAPVESGAVERLTAWLYAREGGVSFNALPVAVQEYWRKQGREVAALATSGEVTEAMIERVARSLARADCDAMLMSEIAIGLYVDKRWGEKVEKAKAAISAMCAAQVGGPSND